MSKPSKDLLAHIKKEIKIEPPVWSKTIDIDTPAKAEKLVPPEIKKELKPTNTRRSSKKAVDFIIPEVEPEPIKAPVPPPQKKPPTPSSSESEEEEEESEEGSYSDSEEEPETPTPLRGRMEDPVANFVRNRTMLGMYGMEKSVAKTDNLGGFVMQRATQHAAPSHPPVQGDSCVIQ